MDKWNKWTFVCPDCESHESHTELVNDVFEYGAGNDRVELRVSLPVHVCADCRGEFLSDIAEALRHNAVCNHLNLLTPTEIKEIRDRLTLSQAGLAELSGVGVASIGRWESGKILQTRGNDKLLRLLAIDGNADFIRNHIAKDVRIQSQRN